MENAESILNSSQIQVKIDDETVIIDVEKPLANPVSVMHISGSTYSILHRGKSLMATLVRHGPQNLEFVVDGVPFRCDLMNRRMQLMENLSGSGANKSHEGELTSPMPGLVVKILAAEGNRVDKNEPLIVLEAMKMENEIRSPFDALVTKIHVRSGESVSKNILLISLDAISID